MSSVVVSGDTSGAITLAAPAVSGTTTLTLPATTGTVLASNSASTINSGTSSSMTLQTNGTTAVTVDTSQNVGIGTTSPSRILDVQKSQNAETAIRVFNSNSGSSAYCSYILGNDTNSAISGIIQNSSTFTSFGGGANSFNIYQGYAAPMAFLTNSTERMRIDSTGNVLIGTTTSPAGTKELVLGGDYIEGVVSIGTVTTSNTLSLANGTVQTATLTASTACTFTMPTAIAGKSFMLLLKQAAATGNGTATFTSVKWNAAGAPTITATAGKMDILSFISDGTNWYGSYTQGYTP